MIYLVLSFSVSVLTMEKGKAPANNDLLMAAASKGMTTGVQELIQNNPKLDVDEALAAAAKFGRVEVVKQLLKAKADPNVRDKEGNTPLIMAIDGEFGVWRGDVFNCFAYGDSRAKNAEIIAKILLKAGANPNIVDAKQQSPLLFAMEKGWREMVVLLLNHGADPNQGRTKEGKTALMISFDQVTQMLLKKGAKIDEKDKDGQTALFYKAGSGPGGTRTFKILLEAGADVTIRNNKNESILQYTMQHGKEKRLKLLKKYGATL